MMIVLTWIAHCVLIASVLTAGAFAWEAGARWWGSSARWGWFMALAGSVSLPWLVRLLPAEAAEVLPAGIPAIRLDALTLESGAAGAGLSGTQIGMLLWVASSALVLLYVGYALTQLAQQRRRWREAELEGGRVLLTNGVGPAAVGVRAGMVIVPTWALDMDAELRTLLLRHEREHVRAGDPRLLLGGLVLLAAMPWNPFVWLLVMRLRNAIELDCDARVLSSGVDPERYGSLLLEVGRRRSASALVMATFAEPRVFLEERIRRIAHWPPHRRPVRAGICALLGMALFGTAMCAPDPLRPRELPTEPVTESVPMVDAAEDVMAGPTFTPMTVRPELQNRAVVAAALDASYPPLLRDAGIGGAPRVWFYIDAEGSVMHARMSRSSGYPALDEAALAVARQMRFSPALNQGVEVPVWVEIPIVFSAGDARLAPTHERSPQLRQPGQPTERAAPPSRIRAPTGDTTQTTRLPELQNRAAVARLLLDTYPPLLRDAGIGGAPVVWFHILETGAVARVQISESSGHPALDEAALKVAARMQFTPALNGDQRVPVWIEIPIVFNPR